MCAAKSPGVPGVSGNEKRIVLLTSIGHALCHISELAFPAVIVAVMSEFGLTADRAALLAVPGFVLYGVGAVPAGFWADRRGAREAMTAYFALVALASLSIFFAGSTWSLCAGLTFLGLAISIYHPVGLAMLAHGCVHRGRAMGINGVAGSLGVATGPALGLWMVTHFSWRWAYAAIAALAALGLLSVLWLRIRVPYVERGDAPSGGGAAGAASWRVLAILFVAMLVGGFNYRCLTTVLPTFLSGVEPTAASASAEPAARAGSGPRSPRPADESVAAGAGAVPQRDRAGDTGMTLVFLVFALGGIGQLLGGYLADRFRPPLVYVLTISSTVPLAVLLSRSGSGPGAVLAAALATFMFAQQPLENTMIAAATPARWRSTVYGLKFILAFGVASWGAYVAGLVWNEYGLPQVFLLFAACAAVMAAMAGAFSLLQRPRRNLVPGA
jgi:MFS family permease